MRLAAYVSLVWLLNLADLATTYLFLGYGYPEGNPVMTFMFAHFGFIGMIPFKLFFYPALVAACFWKADRIAKITGSQSAMRVTSLFKISLVSMFVIVVSWNLIGLMYIWRS